MQGLACPHCRTTLTDTPPAGLRCATCQIEYPALAGVPWLWPEPQAALQDWRNRYSRLLAEVEQHVAACQAALNNKPQDSTRQRLQALRAGLHAYQQQLQELLAPLDLGPGLARETHLALRTQLPQHHSLDAYSSNIMRDWNWGDEENNATASLLTEQLTTYDIKPRRALVLGSGAGRLAYDLHVQLGLQQTVTLDSNPLLCLLAAKLSAGQTQAFTEFPRAPRSAADCAVTRQLAAPAAVDNFTVVCADALNTPVVSGHFDLLLTPWLIDVIDAPLTDQISRYAQLLAPGGIWLNHGSLAFNSGDPAQRFSGDEVEQLVAANGFDVLAANDTRLPYLHSPADRQARYETTYTLVARRNPTAAPTPQRYAHSPEWNADFSQPVPLSDAFQLQLTTTRIHAFIMGLIDGKRSIDDIARVLEDQRLMPASQARQAVLQFLQVMQAEAEAQQRLY